MTFFLTSARIGMDYDYFKLLQVQQWKHQRHGLMCSLPCVVTLNLASCADTLSSSRNESSPMWGRNRCVTSSARLRRRLRCTGTVGSDSTVSIITYEQTFGNGRAPSIDRVFARKKSYPYVQRVLERVCFCFRRPPSATREPFDGTRGMSARSTCYSRHALSRESSAENNKARNSAPADTRPAQAHGSGRARSLHVTSADNPFISGSRQNGR